MLETTKFDVAEYLDTEEVQSCYLNYVAEENDPDELLKAINDVARARGMTKTAKEAGITREGFTRLCRRTAIPLFPRFSRYLMPSDTRSLQCAARLEIYARFLYCGGESLRRAVSLQ